MSHSPNYCIYYFCFLNCAGVTPLILLSRSTSGGPNPDPGDHLPSEFSSYTHAWKFLVILESMAVSEITPYTVKYGTICGHSHL